MTEVVRVPPTRHMLRAGGLLAPPVAYSWPTRGADATLLQEAAPAVCETAG
jgi:hypothetical protein